LRLSFGVHSKATRLSLGLKVRRAPLTAFLYYNLRGTHRKSEIARAAVTKLPNIFLPLSFHQPTATPRPSPPLAF